MKEQGMALTVWVSLSKQSVWGRRLLRAGVVMIEELIEESVEKITVWGSFPRRKVVWNSNLKVCDDRVVTVLLST
jgi:hypothetical protein